MIYFIKRNDGLIKIGVTKSIESRLGSLSNKYGKLELIKLIGGGFKEETALHKLFDDHRRTGEWFFPAPALLAFIESSPNYAESKPEAVVRLGENLKLARLRRRLCVGAVSSDTGISVGVIRSLEAGGPKGTVLQLCQLLEYFNLSEDLASVASDDKDGIKLQNAALLKRKSYKNSTN